MAEKTEKHDVNLPLLLTLGVSTTLVVWLLVIVAQGLYNWQTLATNDQQIARLRPNEYQQALIQQGQTLRTVGWTENPAERRVRIDIDRAMQIVARNGGLLPSTRPAP